VKKFIHPNWHSDAKVVCACGSTFTTGSTIPLIRVETCSACHPFFTGQTHKFVDTAGRVEKFNRRVAAAEQRQAEAEERRRLRGAPVVTP